MSEHVLYACADAGSNDVADVLAGAGDYMYVCVCVCVYIYTYICIYIYIYGYVVQGRKLVRSLNYDLRSPSRGSSQALEVSMN